MTEHDDKAGLPLSQTKLTTNQQQALTERLSKLEDRLHNLLACYQFYDHAIRAMTNPEQLDDSQEWYFGLFLNQQWLREQGERVMAELVDIKVSLKT
jgi:dTDP-4-amino-4,6-dideoxygalactose transaminase